MYERYYKLTGKPFQLSPDPRFFYGSKTHKRALAYLRYGIEPAEGFIVITGDVGAGKTTLVGRLFQSLAGDNVVAGRLVSTQVQADDLLRLVAAEFGLPYQRVTKASLLHQLELFFRTCADEGKRALLVVDEAQNLPRKALEELLMLSNFQWKGRSTLQSFLLGQKEFRNIMRSEGFEQLRQRVIAAYHLRPLDEAETREYIEHRLKMVGWHGVPSIADVVYRGIFDYTQGIPRKINLLADRLMLYGALEQLHDFNAHTIEAVLSDVRQELWRDPEHDEASLDVPRESASEARAPIRSRQLPELDSTKAREQERRLEEMEQSVRSLTSLLKEELSQLREAVLRTDKDE